MMLKDEEALQAITGKTIQCVEDNFRSATLIFTDGTRLKLGVDGEWCEDAWLTAELNPTDG